MYIVIVPKVEATTAIEVKCRNMMSLEVYLF